MDDVAVAQNLNLCDVAVSKVCTVDRLCRSVECYCSTQNIVKRSNCQIVNSCRSVTLSANLDNQLLNLQIEHVRIRCSVDSHIVCASLVWSEGAFIFSICRSLNGCLRDDCSAQTFNCSSLACLNLELFSPRGA